MLEVYCDSQRPQWVESELAENTFLQGRTSGSYSRMSHDPCPIVRPRRRLPRVPPFYPAPLRGRHDGWTAERQADFLGYLGETGSVSIACARVGMSRNSAYKLRRKPHAESFAAAWDAALGMPVRKVAIADLRFLAYSGLVHSRFRGGKYLRWVQKPDSSALLRLLARFDRLIGER